MTLPLLNEIYEVEKSERPILVVEDSDIDFEAMNRLFQKSDIRNPIHRCADGDQALDFLFSRGAYAGDKAVARPGMVLLDLNLPGTDGWEVLRQMKTSPDLRRIPVLVVTGSRHPDDVHHAYDEGASTYICKPEDAAEYAPLIEMIRHYWLGNRFVHLA